MDFGNWPAWIALIFAIVSPLITTLLTNRHQRKMFILQMKNDRSKSCDKLIAELTSLAFCSPASFKGFSSEALEASRYLSSYAFEVFIDFTDELNKIAEMESRCHIYDVMNDVPFYIFPDPSKPGTKKLSKYKEIILFIINELKNET